MTKEQRYHHTLEENFEEGLPLSWNRNQAAMREARRAAAQRRLDQIINP